MKKVLVILFLFCMHLTSYSQADSAFGHKKRIDNYKRLLAAATVDSLKIDYMQHLNFDYGTEDPDSSLKYGLAALELSRKTKNLRQEARTLNGLSGVLGQQGRFAEALENLFEGRKIAEQIHYTREVARSYRRTGRIYSDLANFSKARDYDIQALILDQTISNNQGSIMIDYMILADVYETLNMPDSAQYYANLTVQNRAAQEDLVHQVFLTMGNLSIRKNRPDSALFYYQTALRGALHYSDFNNVSAAANQIAAVYHGQSKQDSALHYAMMAYQFGQKISFKKAVMQATALLADLYYATDARTSLQYYRISNAAKDSLFGTGNIQVIQSLIDREERTRKEAEDARLAFRNRIRLYGLLSGLFLLLVITWLLYRNNKQKQKANLQLSAQKDEVQTALHQLKTTQTQLIQAEKMASLGQLTAGIAHEIQNPLNFVNNFSELNDELVEEANQEINQGDLPAAKKILEDLKENSKRIALHGKRADAIVKSMLQHSRSSSAKKEPVDINALAKEYLGIAMQRLGTKAEQIHAATELDPKMGSFSCAPEEIGKVLLNLLENAFQAVQEKQQQAVNGYEPRVRLTTRRLAEQAIITIEDNGMGISSSNLPKIFQPFFTTRPPGQGTGLGLSLSYDIITKGYQGELIAETDEGVGSVFTMRLPVV